MVETRLGLRSAATVVPRGSTRGIRARDGGHERRRMAHSSGRRYGEREVLVRCLLAVWIGGGMGCNLVDDEPRVDPGHDDASSQDAQDREECRDPPISECPPGFGYQFHGGAANDDLVVFDLAEMGEPVCEGLGTFTPAESLEGVELVGAHITRNSYCTFGCFAGCAFTNMCWSERSDGSACVQACSLSSVDEQGCVEMVRECLGEEGGAQACEGS